MHLIHTLLYTLCFILIHSISFIAAFQVEVLTPAANGEYVVSRDFLITWRIISDSSLPALLHIDLLHSDGVTVTPLVNGIPPLHGVTNVRLPSTLPSGKYALRLWSYAGTNMDALPTFTLTNDVDPTAANQDGLHVQVQQVSSGGSHAARCDEMRLTWTLPTRSTQTPAKLFLYLFSPASDTLLYRYPEAIVTLDRQFVFRLPESLPIHAGLYGVGLWADAHLPDKRAGLATVRGGNAWGWVLTEDRVDTNATCQAASKDKNTPVVLKEDDQNKNNRKTPNNRLANQFTNQSSTVESFMDGLGTVMAVIVSLCFIGGAFSFV